MRHTEKCDGCGRFVQECSLLADGDESICVRCWGRRCAAREATECIWQEIEDGEAWQTSCGELFVINDGTPAENGMVFCHHCGKKLVTP